MNNKQVDETIANVKELLASGKISPENQGAYMQGIFLLEKQKIYNNYYKENEKINKKHKDYFIYIITGLLILVLSLI